MKARSRDPVRCVLFDLDGTLYNSHDYTVYFDSQMTKIVSRFLKIDDDEASRILRSRREEKGTLTRAIESLGMSRLEFHRLVGETVDPSLYLSADQETRRVITRLKQDGFRIGLVSNSGRELVNKILDAIGLERAMFDVIITGSEVEPKPSHQPFLLAIERIGCHKASTIYVGDRDDAEIRPAHELGIRTVLIARTVEQMRIAKWADVVVGSISELEKRIQA